MTNNFSINKRRIEKYLKSQHFMIHIGFELNIIESGRTEGWLKLEKIHQQQTGLVHGGVIASLADVVAGFAAYTVVHPEHHVVTAEIKISYFYPGQGEMLQAIGYVVKSGKKFNFCESEIFAVNNDQRKLIAKASSTMATVFPEDLSSKN
ncbi:PaaI family thioesterase [soil metagenome]